MTAIHKTPYVATFECLGADCADTCCKGWGMQLDVETKEKYEKIPELQDAFDTGEAEWIMKRDPKTDYCTKFDNGLCSIHAKYGDDMLGDACNFFPRITRKVGSEMLMTASLSCPEVARLALLQENSTNNVEGTTNRVPASLIDYASSEISDTDMLAVHQGFVNACTDDTAASSERCVSRILSVLVSMEMLGKNSWAAAVPFYLNNADSRLQASEQSLNDPFNLLYALVGLIEASRPTSRPRLEQTIAEMESALKVTFTKDPLMIQSNEDSYPAWQNMQQRWDDEWSSELDIILKRWLRAELSTSFFPFAGLGNTKAERGILMAVRFATVRLALQSSCVAHNGIPPEEEIIRVVQSLARFLGHLADPTLSLKIYEETGWVKEARLRALVGDF